MKIYQLEVWGHKPEEQGAGELRSGPLSELPGYFWLELGA